MTIYNGDNVLESMGEVWFEVSEEPCGAVFVLTYILSDKKLVTTVL